MLALIAFTTAAQDKTKKAAAPAKQKVYGTYTFDYDANGNMIGKKFTPAVDSAQNKYTHEVIEAPGTIHSQGNLDSGSKKTTQPNTLKPAQ